MKKVNIVFFRFLFKRYVLIINYDFDIMKNGNFIEYFELFKGKGLKIIY